VKRDKIIFLLVGIAVIVFFGYSLIAELEKDCSVISDTECKLLRGASILSIVGGGLLGELIIRRRQSIVNAQKSGEQSAPAIGAWSRATIRIVLSSLLASAPLMVRGSFVVVGCGVFCGIIIVGIFGRLTGRISDEEGI